MDSDLHATAVFVLPRAVCMSTLVFWALVALATGISLGTAWALGANSNSPPFAPAIGANAISTMKAAFAIGILAALGALTQGGSISETVGAGLVDGVVVTSLGATVGLLTATGFMAFGIYTGYPVPAAFATTGAMIGVGLSLGGAPAIATYERIATFWVLVPPVSASLAFGTARLLRREDVPETVSIPLLAALVGAVVANVQLSIVPSPTGAAQGSLAGLAAGFGGPTVGGVNVAVALATLAVAALSFHLIRRRTVASVDRGIKTFLVVLGSIVAFSSGGSQVGLATGPLENLYGAQLGLPGFALLALGGVGILGGAWMGSPRLLQATSREYAQLGVRRSIAALVPGFLIAQAAILFGIPVSFNNIILSGIIGGGLAGGSAGVSRRKILTTLVFWVVTLVGSVTVGYGLYRLAAPVLAQ